MSDDLRDQIGGILSTDPVRCGPGGTADEIMTLFRPVLDAKDTEIERLGAEVSGAEEDAAEQHQNAIHWQERAEKAEVDLAEMRAIATERSEAYGQVAAERDHLAAALAGDSEGVRLWMLDCGNLVDRHRERAEQAEAERDQLRAAIEQARTVHAALGHDRLGGNRGCAMCAALDQPAKESPWPNSARSSAR